MEKLKLKTKTGSEFVIQFDTVEEMIDFLIAYSQREQQELVSACMGETDGN